jgi:hypothetical protein
MIKRRRTGAGWARVGEGSRALTLVRRVFLWCCTLCIRLCILVRTTLCRHE